jgi:hypothetical protein
LPHTCIAIKTYAIFLIYFCNIYTKHLQHTSETFATIETYVCNIGGEKEVGRLRPSSWEPAACEHHQHWPCSWVPLGLARDDHRQGRRRRCILTVRGWERGREGTTQTEGGDDMVGLSGERKQRWRRGALLLPANTRDTYRWGGRSGEIERRVRRSGEMERRARRSGSRVGTDVSGQTPSCEYLHKR